MELKLYLSLIPALLWALYHIARYAVFVVISLIYSHIQDVYWQITGIKKTLLDTKLDENYCTSAQVVKFIKLCLISIALYSNFIEL